MIQFPCQCGFRFELEDDQAGGLAQCPQCGLLKDVPGRDDLRSIEPDGSYRIEGDLEEIQDDAAVADLAYIYQRGHVDAHGNQIDLRNTQADIDVVGGQPVPIDPALRPREQAPRYDPETGELITPLELKDDGPRLVNPASIPMATPALNYASAPARGGAGFFTAFLSLLSPSNLAVMFAVLLMHVIIWPVFFITFIGLFFFIVAIAVVPALILAHYGNVIEDAGPFEKDELPRPMRDLGWYEDVWSPFCNVFGSLVMCYGPAVALGVGMVRVLGPDAAVLGLLGMALYAAMGTFLFPAVLLTLQAGGTILNLRPDRVLAVIGACGSGYLFAVVLWVLTAAVYLWGFLGTTFAIAELTRPSDLPRWLTSWPIVLPALIAGIFLMHYFCLALAMLYRAHFGAFPWVLQRHVRTRPMQPLPGLPPRRIRPLPRPRSVPDESARRFETR